MKEEQIKALVDEIVGDGPYRVIFREPTMGGIITSATIYDGEYNVGFFLQSKRFGIVFYLEDSYVQSDFIINILRDKDKSDVLNGVYNKIISSIKDKFPDDWYIEDLRFVKADSSGGTYLFRIK